MNGRTLLHKIIALVSLLGCLIGCGAPGTPPASGEAGPVAGLSGAEITTLGSLEQVDDYPLYVMTYSGAYPQAAAAAGWGVGVRPLQTMAPEPAWTCSLFAALGDPGRVLYGRNFDWEYSPALLLFTDPPDGYASVSMVDIAYLGFSGARARAVTELPLVERRALLDAPAWPFDGMNEHGLAVGMAAVPESQMPYDGDKPTVGSLTVIREMLDHARDVDEALAILRGRNISWSGGPPLHYLVADRSGRSTLVEFYEGRLVVLDNQAPWHVATNFLRAAAGDSPEGVCRRYERISQRLTRLRGRITPQAAIELLADVSQGNTQWSVVYDMSTGDVRVAVGRDYEDVHTLHLDLAGDAPQSHARIRQGV
jgi:hypothetical protein